MKVKKSKVPSDITIAQGIKLKPITEIASKIGIKREELELYGDNKAKVKLELLNRLKAKHTGKYIDVTAITPTPLGEGKTVTTIGLSLGLAKIGKKVITAIRQPSLGPVFGIKGGAAGGGYSQVVPMEDFNLHLTGDVHAVSIAHNLCAAFLDNHLHKGNKFNIDLNQILWRRVVDISDRALRNVIIGLGGKDDGIARQSGFDISVASEVMAILALTTSLKDLRQRLGRIVVAFTKDGKPVTAEDLGVAGSMTVLMRDAIKPTLLQTTEHTPCFVHAGPFANIAHGNNSILADQMAVKLADYVVTESGFAADMGMEKFMNIKCRYSKLVPNCVVMVCTVRALKMHSGQFTIIPGKSIPDDLLKENMKAIEYIRQKAIQAGAEDAVLSEVWEKGGEGGKELAQAVVKACEKKSKFKFLYPLEASIKEKIEIIATKIYGAKNVSYTAATEDKIKLYSGLGWDKLPICMAKTHLSLSHDPALKGRPTGFTLPVRDIRASIGAGFLYPICGDMRTMPGLPSVPAGTKVDIDKDGKVVGLF